MAGDRRNRIGTQDLTQAAHLDLEIVLLDYESRPNRVEQFVLLHHSLATLDKSDQQVESSSAERSAGAPDENLPLVGADFTMTECITARHRAIPSNRIVARSIPSGARRALRQKRMFQDV